jgi:putative ABC transport system substrate-binding protein
MKKRITALTLCALLYAPCVPAEAQQAVKVPRIGILQPVGGSLPSPLWGAFRQGLRDIGYVEGTNIFIEVRSGEGKIEHLTQLATELVRLKVEVIITSSTPAILAAKKATSTIPIVMAVSGDPVVGGLVASLGHPGGNVTGLTLLAPELNGKRLELVKEAVVRVSRVGVLVNAANPGRQTTIEETEAAARPLGVQLEIQKVRSPNEFESTFSEMERKHVGALTVLEDPLFNSHIERVVTLAAKHHLAAIYPRREFVEVGGLMSYGPNWNDLFRRAAAYVDKILKGAKPADLPVEQPTKFELIINLKAAKQIGLMIPPNMLARADKVVK